MRDPDGRSERVDVDGASPEDVFGDPLAGLTGWTPIGKPSASFRTHRLVAVGPGRMIFRPMTTVYLVGGMFVVVGVGIVAALLISGYLTGFAASGFFFYGKDVLGPILGLGLVGAAMVPLYSMGKPRVFDTEAGYYWRAWQSPGQLLPSESEAMDGQTMAHLADVRRMNVIDHGNGSKVLEDAEQLAEFLGGLPVWDDM